MSPGLGKDVTLTDQSIYYTCLGLDHCIVQTPDQHLSKEKPQL